MSVRRATNGPFTSEPLEAFIEARPLKLWMEVLFALSKEALKT